MSGRTERFQDHWWWREGWGPGTRYLTWHVLLDDQPEVRAQVRTHHEALRDVIGLGPVPEEWLHLTLSGVGFAREVTDQERRLLVEAAARGLADVPVAGGVVGRAVVFPEGVALPVEAPGLLEVRARLRRAAAEVLGADRVVDVAPHLWPHVTVAYAEGDADAGPAHVAVGGLALTATMVVRRVSLLELERDERVYRWRVLGQVPLRG